MPHILTRVAAACAALLLAGNAAAQAWPAKPIKIVVPFAAGGTSDILARAIGQKLSEAVGQSVIIEPRAGANGNVGADYVAKSAPDGYTLLLTDTAVLSVNPSVYPNMPYDPARDLAPVVMVSYSPHVLGVHPSVPVKTVKELIDYAKTNPGKLNFAVSGTGGAPHLAGIEFAQRTGVAWAYIPYKGGSQAVADVAAGQSNVIMNGMLATYPTVKSGRIRGIAVSSLAKVAAAPELPAIAEVLPGFETGSFQGIVAPAGTPAEVVGKLNAEVTRALALPEMKERLAAQGTEVKTGTPQALGQFLAAERVRWARVIKESGIKFD
jgi:tripartite-type tricarboxylate transporter receptor subunit TctC